MKERGYPVFCTNGGVIKPMIKLLNQSMGNIISTWHTVGEAGNTYLSTLTTQPPLP